MYVLLVNAESWLVLISFISALTYIYMIMIQSHKELVQLLHNLSDD